jgi:hypothetical protein
LSSFAGASAFLSSAVTSAHSFARRRHFFLSAGGAASKPISAFASL